MQSTSMQKTTAFAEPNWLWGMFGGRMCTIVGYLLEDEYCISQQVKHLSGEHYSEIL